MLLIFFRKMLNMKYTKTFLATTIFLLKINLAFGTNDGISLHQQDATEIVSISQFFSRQDQAYLVTATLNASNNSSQPKSSLRLIDFKSGKVVTELPVEQAPLVSPPGPQTSVLALPRLGPDIQWKIHQPDPKMTTLGREKNLPTYAVVTQTLQDGRNYYVFGMSQQNEPIVSVFGPELTLVAEHAYSDFSPSMITSALVLDHEILALISSENGSMLLKVSKDLQTISETRIDGFGASGVILPGGGFALTYVTSPDMVVTLERFDVNHKSRWKAPLYEMSKNGVSSGVKLAAVPSGIAFSGFNNDQLLIGSISIDGENKTIKLASKKGLEFDPSPSSHFIFTHHNSIHVWGLAMDAQTLKNIIYRADYE